MWVLGFGFWFGFGFGLRVANLLEVLARRRVRVVEAEHVARLVRVKCQNTK